MGFLKSIRALVYLGHIKIDKKTNKLAFISRREKKSKKKD